MGNGYIDSYASGKFITDVISKIRQIIVKVKKNSEDLLTKADLIDGKIDPSQLPVNFPVYADNIAALGGGLTAGAFYRTSTGTLMVAY